MKATLAVEVVYSCGRAPGKGHVNCNVQGTHYDVQPHVNCNVQGVNCNVPSAMCTVPSAMCSMARMC